MSRLRGSQLALVAVSLVALAVVVWDLLMGGFYFRVVGVRVSSWEAYKPFRVALAAMVAAIQLHDWSSPPSDTSWNVLVRWSRGIALAVALGSIAVAVHYGIFAAGGADAYGYVSQAALWAEGHLSAPDPLASVAALVGPAAAPLGYRAAATPGFLVPTYPAGLPIAMAFAMKIGGASGMYFVVPLLSGLAVWLTFLLGVRVGGERAGVVAAIFIAFSPIFVFQSLEPMSDVPVTAWWLLAWWCALSPRPAAAIAGGLAVSAAVLTRPNLVPLAMVLGCVVAVQTPRLRRVALFSVGMIPGCLAVGALNAFWYGNPFLSGYGALSNLYLGSRAIPNLHQYAAWLIELHTGAILLATAGPFVARAKGTAAAMVAFFVFLLGCYLFYFVYDTWPFLRFLLPGIPLLLVLASTSMVALFERLPLRIRGTMVFLTCTLAAMTYVLTADRLHVFNIQTAEHRYVAVGEYVDALLPPNAVVVTVIQSGSVRLYGRRPTLRWDLLPPDRLDETLDGVRSAGYVPYLLLESWEDDQFRERFRTTSVVGSVDWRSVLEYYGPVTVRVLRPEDRHAYYSGRSALPRAVPYP